MLLLDTHVALWLVGDHHRIGPKSRNRIRTSPATYFSAISIAEVTIKRLQGRLEDAPNDSSDVCLTVGSTACP